MADSVGVSLSFEGGITARAKWFKGTSDDLVHDIIASAVGLDPGSCSVYLVDSEGYSVPACTQLPGGSYEVIMVARGTTSPGDLAPAAPVANTSRPPSIARAGLQTCPRLYPYFL